MPISPNTPIGTPIVCVDDQGNYRKDTILTKFIPVSDDNDLDGLKKGVIYTVHSIYKMNDCASGYSVVLNEIRRTGALVPGDHGYDLNRFEYLVARPVFKRETISA